MLEYIRSKLYEKRQYIADFIIMFAVFLLGYFAGYMYGIRNVSDNGTGTATVGQQFNEAATNIGSAKDGIEQSIGAVNDSKERIDYVQSTITTSTDILEQCKQIIAGIRKRGKTETVKN